jgi:hypothetical protein
MLTNTSICDIINLITGSLEKYEGFYNKGFMKRKYRRAIKKIAEQEGVSPEFIYDEMQKVINIGYNNLDPFIRGYWNKLVFNGGGPTPEKVIGALSQEIKSAKKTKIK